METLKVVICDDNEGDRRYYEALAFELAEKWNVDMKIRSFISGNDLLFAVDNRNFLKIANIMFLDINMPGANGLQVARKARKSGYKGLIVFLTASETAYEPAFDLRGFNYITKNENAPTRFEKVLAEAVKEVRANSQQAIILSGGGRYVQVDISAIKYFEVNRNTITVYYGDESFEFISTLNKLENRMASHGFCRVQRAYLVNLAYVYRITFEKVYLRDGTEITVGRKYYQGLKEAFGDKRSTEL